MGNIYLSKLIKIIYKQILKTFKVNKMQTNKKKQTNKQNPFGFVVTADAKIIGTALAWVFLVKIQRPNANTLKFITIDGNITYRQAIIELSKKISTTDYSYELN